MIREQLSRLMGWRRLRVWEAAISSWGWHAGAPAPVIDGDAGPARQAMIALLADLPAAQAAPLARAMATAHDPVALWQLRGGLMHALALRSGEGAARARLEAIDRLLLDAWPQAPVSRPAPLR